VKKKGKRAVDRKRLTNKKDKSPRRKKKPTKARNVLARLRERDALDLRLSGATYPMIGKALGISKQAAHKRVMEALNETAEITGEKAVEVRGIELQRQAQRQRIDPAADADFARGLFGQVGRCALDVATEFCPGQGCAQTGKPRSGYGPGLLRVTTAKWRERMNAEVEAVGSDDDYSRREFGPI